MKRTILLVLAIGLISITFGSHDRARAQRSRAYAGDRILLKMRSGSGQLPVSEEIGSEILETKQVRTRRIGDLQEFPLYLLYLNGELSVEEALARALANSRVEYAEPDYFIYPADTTPDDPEFGRMWGLLNTETGPFSRSGADIGAVRAWDLTTGNPDVVVAVIDSGVAVTHPDLAANIWQNPGEIERNGIDDDGNGLVDDVNGWNFVGKREKDENNDVTPDPRLSGAGFIHGTHVAGTVGAVGNNGIGVTGVAWTTKLIALKIFGVVVEPPDDMPKFSGSTSDAVEAIEYVISLKRRGVNVAAINASWGARPDQEEPDGPRSLRDAITDAGNRGITFVCAAGNGQTIGLNLDNPDQLFFPAAWRDIPSLISVAALDRADNLNHFSNYGRLSVSVGAPGVEVFSTIAPGGYGNLSGTSMSSPHVAGIVALLAAREPGLSPSAVRRRIESTAEPIISLATKTVSAGRANAFNALTNTLARVDTPGVVAASATKKFLILDGLGFKPGAVVVEVNSGAVDRKMIFADSFALANGTYTHVEVKFGKELMNALIPRGIPVTLTVFNSQSGQRSAPFPFVRF